MTQSRPRCRRIRIRLGSRTSKRDPFRHRPDVPGLPAGHHSVRTTSRGGREARLGISRPSPGPDGRARVGNDGGSASRPGLLQLIPCPCPRPLIMHRNRWTKRATTCVMHPKITSGCRSARLRSSWALFSLYGVVWRRAMMSPDCLPPSVGLMSHASPHRIGLPHLQ